MSPQSLHARLGGYYFFYYATVGAFMPYWSPYLEARGFTATQIGIAYAFAGISRATMPFLWGWLGDHSGRRIHLVRITSVASLALFLLIPFVDGVWAITAAMLAYNLFWQALLSQFETVSMVHLAKTGGDYSRVRLWGSVGFVVSVLSLGPLLDLWGILPLPWLVGVLFAGMAASSYLVPETVSPPHDPAVPMAGIGSVIKRPEVIALFIACLCSQMSFAPYYNFFTLFLERHGHPRSLSGILWAIAVIAEIVLFFYMSRVIAKVGAKRLLLAALGTTVLRWLLTVALADSFTALIFIQMSHALTFGAYHACAMHYVFTLFPVRLQGRGQAIYNASAYGVGGSLGSLGAGAIWDHVRPEATFLIAAIIALIGTWIVWKKVPNL
ncbi:MAG: MFS transporter [Stagnimonas sp.]|nr:MFS transporter [Stagnimonas sp.]